MCIPGAGSSTDICHAGTAVHNEDFENGLSSAWRFTVGAGYVRGSVLPNQGQFVAGPPYRYAGNGGLQLRHDGECGCTCLVLPR